jgi:hypothetical protein
VKRLQITIDRIRRYVRDRLRPKPLPPIDKDPLSKFAGVDRETEPVEDIDAFLYGPTAEA